MLYKSAFTKAKGSVLLDKIDSSLVRSPNFLRVRCSCVPCSHSHVLYTWEPKRRGPRGAPRGKAGLQRPTLRNPASTGPVLRWATRAADRLGIVLLAGQMGRNSRGFRALGLRSFSSPSVAARRKRSQSRLTRPAAEDRSAQHHPLRPPPFRREPAAVSAPSPARWPR